MRHKLIILQFGMTALVAPAVAFAAPKTFADLVGFFLSYINIAIPIVISAAILVYMKNTATGIYGMKNGQPNPEWQQSMFWGIVIIAVMVSLWGILSIIGNTLHF